MANKNKLGEIIKSLKNIQDELLDMDEKDLKKIALQSKGLLPSEIKNILESCADNVGGIAYDLEKI